MRNGLKALFGAFCGLIVALLAVRSLSANSQSTSVIERVMAGGMMDGVLGMLLGLLFWAFVVALVVGLWVWLVIQVRDRR